MQALNTEGLESKPEYDGGYCGESTCKSHYAVWATQDSDCIGNQPMKSAVTGDREVQASLKRHWSENIPMTGIPSILRKNVTSKRNPQFKNRKKRCAAKDVTISHYLFQSHAKQSDIYKTFIVENRLMDEHFYETEVLKFPVTILDQPHEDMR